MSGVMMAGALTQWNAASSASTLFGNFGACGVSSATPIGASASVAWDWGMGWGWAGWTPEGAIGGASAAAFCGSCALEQHHADLAASSTSVASNNISSTSYHQIPYNGRHEFYYDDDHELGELGETADVGCDFGGDFGGF